MIKKIFKSEWAAWIMILTLSVAVSFFVKTFFYGSFYIKSDEMESTLLTGDFVLVDKTAYGINFPFQETDTGIKPLNRNDIVACKTGNSYKISRCLAIQGDTITLKGGNCLINNKIIQQGPDIKRKYIFPIEKKSTLDKIIGKLKIKEQTEQGKDSLAQVYLSNFEFYLIRSGLSDASWIKQKNNMQEEYRIIIPPLCCWLLSDHAKEVSSPEEIKLTPYKNIIGKARFILFSKDLSSTNFFSGLRLERTLNLIH